MLRRGMSIRPIEYFSGKANYHLTINVDYRDHKLNGEF